jgi:hypothetical protein
MSASDKNCENVCESFDDFYWCHYTFCRKIKALHTTIVLGIVPQGVSFVAAHTITVILHCTEIRSDTHDDLDSLSVLHFSDMRAT